MSIDRRNARDIKAPTGPELTCGSWQTEAPFRMLHEQSATAKWRKTLTSWWSMAASAAPRALGGFRQRSSSLQDAGGR